MERMRGSRNALYPLKRFVAIGTFVTAMLCRAREIIYSLAMQQLSGHAGHAVFQIDATV